MTGDSPLQVDLPDGRVLEVRTAGPEDGEVLLVHHGTPLAALPYRPRVEAAAARGLRIVMYSRPGYATSSPQPGRRVIDAAGDAARVLDALRVTTFRTIGESGGGPHALACAAALPERCLATVAVASVAPYAPDEFDWFAGMGEENVEEYRLALQGEAALTPALEAFAAAMSNVTAADLVSAMGSVVCEADKARMTPERAEHLLASMRLGLSRGIAGARDDDLAFVSDWGFDLGDVRRVAIWHGDQDRMVPFGHGVWLAEHIPGARGRLVAGEGHSIGHGNFEQILDDLLSL